MRAAHFLLDLPLHQLGLTPEATWPCSNTRDKCSWSLLKAECSVPMRNFSCSPGSLPAESSVRPDDGDFDVVEPGVVGRAEADLQTAQVDVAHAVQAPDQRLRGRQLAGALQAFDQHLRAGETFDHGRRHLL